MFFSQTNFSIMQIEWSKIQLINDGFKFQQLETLKEQKSEQLKQRPQNKTFTQEQKVYLEQMGQKYEQIQRNEKFQEIQAKKDISQDHRQSSISNSLIGIQVTISMSSLQSSAQKNSYNFQNHTKNNISQQIQQQQQQQQKNQIKNKSHNSQSSQSLSQLILRKRLQKKSHLYDDISFQNPINNDQNLNQINQNIQEISKIQFKDINIQPHQKVLFERVFYENMIKKQKQKQKIQKLAVMKSIKQDQEFKKDLEGSQKMGAYNDKILKQIELIQIRLPQIYNDLIIIFQEFHPRYSKKILYKLRQRLTEIKDLKSFFPADILQQIKQEFKYNFIYSLDLQDIYSLDKQQKIRHKERILNMNLLRLVQLRLGSYPFSDDQFKKLIYHLSNSKVLKSLCLQKASVNSLKFHYFLDFSEKFKRIIKIYLSKNQICDQGFIKFVEKGQTFSYLKIAMFSQNRITNKGFNYFIQNRYRFNKLRDISLERNQIRNLANKQILYDQKYWNKNLKNQQFFRFSLMGNPLDRQSYSAIFQYINYLRTKQIGFDIYIDPQTIEIKNQKQFMNYICYFQEDRVCIYQDIALKNIKQLNMQQYILQQQTFFLFLKNLRYLQGLKILKLNLQKIQNMDGFIDLLKIQLFTLTEIRQGRQKLNLIVDISRSNLKKKYKKQLFQIYKHAPYVSFSYIYNSQEISIHQKRKYFIELKIQIMKLIKLIALTGPGQHYIKNAQQICKQIFQKIKKLILELRYSFQKIIKTIKRSYQLIQQGFEVNRQQSKIIHERFQKLFVQYAHKIKKIKYVNLEKQRQRVQQIQQSYNEQLNQIFQFSIPELKKINKPDHIELGKYYPMDQYDNFRNNAIKETFDKFQKLQLIQHQAVGHMNNFYQDDQIIKKQQQQGLQIQQEEEKKMNYQNYQIDIQNQMNSQNENYEFSRIIQEDDVIFTQLQNQNQKEGSF